MAARSFTVFLDNPQPDIVKPKAFDIAETIRLPLTSQSTLNNALAPAAKENLDPVTGQRPGSATTATSKKRKNGGILVTKVHNPPTSKKQKESTSTSSKSKLDTKKPKSSSTPKTKSASSEDKGMKRAASGKKSTSSRSSKSSSRKVSPMPKLDEEGDVLGRERETIRQAEIDSRCYELTVLPLADVTQAYDASSSMAFPPNDEKLVLSRSVKVCHAFLSLLSRMFILCYRRDPRNLSYAITTPRHSPHLHPCLPLLALPRALFLNAHHRHPRLRRSH